MNDLKLELNKLKDKALQEFKKIKDSDVLWLLEKKYLGRNGELAKLAKEIKNIAAEQKPVIGEVINEVKTILHDALDDIKSVIGVGETSTGQPAAFDPTLPGADFKTGSLHPFTLIIHQLNEAFQALGFEVYEGPEITSEEFVFDSLNFPADHPARETMDTYWLAESLNKQGLHRHCLRPHLTGASVRYMQSSQPPFRIVYPGRVFRAEATDASHERCFYQYEALMVDKDISFSSGRLLAKTILQTVFGQEVKIRMRAGYFAFVEPGFEIDMACLVCQGKGCSVCSQTGWVEMMPGGTPHPNVLKAGGLDPDKWTGFYINLGIDRIVMMKQAINDIRLFHSGDLRFLEQF